MAKRNFLVDIDLSQNELLKAKIETLTSPPNDPVIGQIYFDNTKGQMGVCTNVVGPIWSYFGNIVDILGDNTSNISISIDGNGVATVSQSAATTIANGYMSSGDKEKLDSATSIDTPNTLMFRDNDGNVEVNKITINQTPTLDTDGVNKAYVDGAIQGLSIKDSVRVISLSDIVLSGLQSIDGINLQDGDRVLVAAQISIVENGIYVASTGSWVRSDDFKAGDSVVNSFMFINEGVLYADTGWVCTNDIGSDIVGIDELLFTQFSGTGSISAGNGLIKTGSIIDIVPGDTSLEVSPSDIIVNRDPIGAIGLDIDGISINTDDNFIKKETNQLTIGTYTSRIAYKDITIGTVSGPQIIAHNFDTQSLNVQVIDTATFEQLGVSIIYLTSNTIQVSANGQNRSARAIITGNIGEEII